MAQSRPTVTFLGGVGTVTGSKFLLDTGASRVLIDCGMFQGLSSLRRRNWAEPPVDWDTVDAVVVTHAHLDHTGYLPVLARQGWAGPVYLTPGTARLAQIVLADSAHLQEEDARYAAEGGWSKHSRPLPLYDTEDAARACDLFVPVRHGENTQVTEDATLTFGRAGHILGSAWAMLTAAGASRRLIASGDLGRPSHPLLRPPEPRPTCDVLLLESTYGDRPRHDPGGADTLASTIARTVERGGSVLIPAFAVDRTEVLLMALDSMIRDGRIPDVPIVIDSPMALACLRVYRQAIEQRWPEIRGDVRPDALSATGLVEVHTAEESKRWNRPASPSIIISASGMATGGRVLHHLKSMLPDRRHTVAIIGFAAEGTRARQLADGARQVKIHGDYIPVRSEVVAVDFSAHASGDELVRWAAANDAPRVCYVVHGEQHSSQELARRLQEEHHWTAVAPREAERVVV
jgi:metallo-beta-lactamase family protein